MTEADDRRYGAWGFRLASPRTALVLGALFAVLAVALDSVRDGLVGVVRRALEPAHVSVWVRERPDL